MDHMITDPTMPNKVAHFITRTLMLHITVLHTEEPATRAEILKASATVDIMSFHSSDSVAGEETLFVVWTLDQLINIILCLPLLLQCSLSINSG